MKTLLLTPRDIKLLEELCAHRAVPLEHLAARFFARNPFTGEVNAQPEKACERRIASLSAAGFVMKFHGEDGRRARVLVGAGPRARSVLGSKARGRVPVTKLAHHARTLDALLVVEESVRRRGGRVLDSRIEQQVRSDVQRGRFLVAGDSFSPFPDAVCTAELPGRDGRSRRVRIAVEYATSKYTDADILQKHEGFVEYDEVVWFADRPRTSERVRRITGASCSIVK